MKVLCGAYCYKSTCSRSQRRFIHLQFIYILVCLWCLVVLTMKITNKMHYTD